MFRKVLFVLAGTLAALSPIAIFSSGWWPEITVALSGGNSTEYSDGWGGDASGSWPVAADPTPARQAPRWPDEGPAHDLAEALRFDVTPDWIVARWPRVSAGLAHLELQGYRVPLVTGTAEDDLAGALTYYFNPRQQLQRITFHGTTGDTRKLVALLSARFGFARRVVNDPGVFLYERPDSDGRPTSFLWLRPARVVRASEPHHRFEVAFLIERP